jgi:hypothetical protein
MPRFSRILHIGSQDDGPVIWALVDPGQPPEERVFFVYGTGHPFDDTGLEYRGTTQTESGFLWHVFEKPIERNIGELILESLRSPEGQKR